MNKPLKTYRIQYSSVFGDRFHTVKGYSLPKVLKHLNKSNNLERIRKVYLNDKLVPDTYLFKLIDKLLWQRVKQAR